MNRIDVLPDDVLLRMFDFYVDVPVDMSPSDYDTRKPKIEVWQSLVHVCRRWRSLVLTSPRRLNLRLVCTPKTPVKDTLDIWPALPLIVAGDMSPTLSESILSPGTDNIIAALEQSNRVCQVSLWSLLEFQLEKVLATMQVPFPELTDLRLVFDAIFATDLDIPDSFLGGSAPRLHSFSLDEIPFPGLPKLLLSATRLVKLHLTDIPYFGFISSGAMVDPLSVLSCLEVLSIELRYPYPHLGWERQRLSPLNPTILPALRNLHFEGNSQYLEDLVSRIDTPQLRIFCITFFSQNNYDCPRLAQFINCTPKLRAPNQAHVRFDDRTASVKLLARSRILEITIPSRESRRQLMSVPQICNSSLPPPSTVEDLYVEHQYSQLDWEEDAPDYTFWLEIFRPFTAVKNLYLSMEFAPDIVDALQDLIGARITEVFPSLQNIFLEGLYVEPSGHLQESIWQFAGARQQSGHPLAIFDWDNDSDIESM